MDDVDLKVQRIPGMIRGMLHEGIQVTPGFECGEWTPWEADCTTISDKARAVAGGVLEAVLRRYGSRDCNKTKKRQNHRPPHTPCAVCGGLCSLDRLEEIAQFARLPPNRNCVPLFNAFYEIENRKCTENQAMRHKTRVFPGRKARCGSRSLQVRDS